MAEKVSAAEATELLDPKPSSSDAGGLPPEQGLEILGADPETFTTSQGDISIGPMLMDQIADFLGVSEQLLPALMPDKEGEGLTFNITRLLAKDKDGFFRAISVATNTDVERIRKLTPEEFIKITTKVFVVNMDFFILRLPALLGMAEQSVVATVMKLVQKAGRMPSNSSSSTATPSKQ